MSDLKINFLANLATIGPNFSEILGHGIANISANINGSQQFCTFPYFVQCYSNEEDPQFFMPFYLFPDCDYNP
jgi:hypothetical protein